MAPRNPPLWAPNVHAERRPFLLARAAIMRELREFFAALEFIEVETAALQVSPGNETHVHAFKTELVEPGRRDRRFLRASPEFSCKKLLAAGERRIVEFARVFRNRERGPVHHPEFTMVEWYRAHGRYELLMDDCMAVIARAAETVGTRQLSFRDRIADPYAEPDRLTVIEAFAQFADMDLREFLTPQLDHRHFAIAASDIGVRISADDTWNDVFSRIMSEKIEPYLGSGRATILDEYPTAMSVLARPKANDPMVAERFEIFVCGVELANGFSELTDPVEQRRLLQHQMAEKDRIYHERYPIDDDFINALRILPPSCGVALGFDRLVMLASGAPDIEHVMWFPVAEV
jgi:elongation factor P--(R)-beta-lysine ligase